MLMNCFASATIHPVDVTNNFIIGLEQGSR